MEITDDFSYKWKPKRANHTFCGEQDALGGHC